MIAGPGLLAAGLLAAGFLAAGQAPVGAPGDVLPTILLLLLLLVALGLVMPFTGGRAARRREAWARFDAMARIRNVPARERGLMERWARVSCARAPHLVLVRRKDFDRFVRSEVARYRGLPRAAYEQELQALGDLRALLGFGPGAGPAQGSHDLLPGEPLVLRQDDGQRVELVVDQVDEEGISVEVDWSPAEREGRRGRGRGALGSGQGFRGRLEPGWATFSREGEGYYRFRTTPLATGRLAHGDFLVHDERRRDPRVPIGADAFWVAVERLPDGAAPEDPEGVEVEVVDVSVGGLALLADREVRRGSELWLDLPLGRGEVAPKVRGLRAKVLQHAYREGGGRRPHFLHCQFIELPDAPRKVLEGYVFNHAEEAA
ncbi:MAG: PilZ domain-containing protein [Planctomycetota bacterium]